MICNAHKGLISKLGRGARWEGWAYMPLCKIMRGQCCRLMVKDEWKQATEAGMKGIVLYSFIPTKSGLCTDFLRTTASNPG